MKRIIAIMLATFATVQVPYVASASNVDFIYYQDFNSLERDRRPSMNTGISLESPSPGTGSITVRQKTRGDNCLYVDVSEANKLLGPIIGFPRQTGNFDIQFDINCIKNNPNIPIGSNDVNIFPVLTQNVFSAFNGQTRENISGSSLTANQWLNVRVALRPSERKYDIYLDGEKMAENFTFRTNNTALSSIKFTGGMNTSATQVQFYIDNILVYSERDRQAALQVAAKLSEKHKTTNAAETATRQPEPPKDTALRDVLADATALSVGKSYMYINNFRLPIDLENDTYQLKVIDGQAMLPYTAVARILGVSATSVDKEVSFDSGRLVVNAGKSEMVYQNVPFNAGVVSLDMDGTIYVPLRYAIELFGGTIVWDDRGMAVVGFTEYPLNYRAEHYMDELMLLFGE